MTTTFRGRRLRKATQPFPDESMRGLVCRALGDHGVPNSWTVLKLVGQLHRNVVSIAEDPELDVRELARILRLDADELLARRYVDLGDRRRLFFGMEIPSAAIEDRIRRFSPAGLAKSPHVRSLWELRDIPFCGETWDMLTDKCRCGVAQRFVRLNGVHRCDDCGRPLSLAPTEQVPVDVRADLSLITGIASPVAKTRQEAISRLPDAIRAAESGAIYQAIVRLRKALAGPDPQAAQDLRALASACAAMLEWPTGIRRLDAGPEIKRSTWKKAIDAYLAIGAPKGEDAPIAETDMDHGSGRPAKRAKPATSFRNGLIGMHPATKLTGLAPNTLLTARDRGQLGRYERSFGERVLPAFDPAELATFADAFRRSMTVGAIGVRLGLGSWAVERIGHAGLLDAPAIRMNRDGIAFEQSAVTSLERAIASAAVRTVSDPVPLHRALLSIHGRTKPWGRFVAALLSGDVPYDLSGPGDQLFRRMRVAADAFEAEAFGADASELPIGPRGAVVVKQQALEMLNGDYNSDILRRIRGSGVNPVLYALEDVEALGRSAISSTELGWRRRKSTRRVHARLVHLGVPKMAKDFWSRPEIELLLEQRMI